MVSHYYKVNAFIRPPAGTLRHAERHPYAVSHPLNRRSSDGKWKVLRCAHALPGINVKAQKWRYTVPSSTPVSEFHRRFLYSSFTPN